MDARTLQKINEPDFLNAVCDHVSSGGALPDLCQQLKIKFSRVNTWIYDDPERRAAYDLAIKARAEWTIQSLLNELKEIALLDIRQAYDENNNLLPVNQWPHALAKSVQALEVVEEFNGSGRERVQVGWTKRVKFWDKIRAIELIGKNLHLFKDQIEFSTRASLEDLVLGSMSPPKMIEGNATPTPDAAAPPTPEKISETNFPGGPPTPEPVAAAPLIPAPLPSQEIEK